VQDLLASSFDTWIKFYRPDENASNSRISYYVKGALVGMLLDAQIRLNTQDKYSLDDCMRELWKRHRETGYTNEDFSNIVQELAGQSVSDWLDDQLSSTKELDYQVYLDAYGLTWKPKDPPKANAPEPQKDANPESQKPATVAHFGLELSNVSGKAQIDKVFRGGSAGHAGLQVGDELIALDGYRIGAEQWAERVGMLQVGQDTTVLLSRRGKILELPLKILPEAFDTATPSWNLVRVDKPTQEQEKRWKSWLQIPEQAQSGAPDGLEHSSPSK
jgi:predicted metalloprotease with PDZ domain